MTTSTQWNVVGDLWVGDDGTTLEALGPSSGLHLVARGRLRALLLAGAASSPALDFVAHAAPEAGAVARALAEGPTRPLTRADVLAGSGRALLFVELTARCNERCTHCYAEASPERTETLSASVVERVLDDGARLGFTSVQFTGGDPLLHPDLVSLVAHARAAGFAHVELFTNGLSLSDELLDRLAPFSVSLAFSVYSHDAAEHDAVTCVPGSHARTLRAVRRGLARGLAVRAGVTLTPSAVGAGEDGAEVRAWLHTLGLRDEDIRITSSRAVGRGVLREHELEGAHGLLPDGADGKACVASDGSVLPCIFGRRRVLGNVHETSLAEVLAAPLEVRAGVDLAGTLDAARARLACADCRLVDALLGPVAEAPGPAQAPLVVLRRPAA